MIFTTQLELNITIKDVNAMYATDYDQMLLDHAKLMYQGKCRDGQFIKSIDKLVRRSLPNLIQRDLNAKVRVYVLVEAIAVRYDQYDFITGMKVTKIIPAGKIGSFDTIECKNDHVVALMRVQKGFDAFKIGSTIPIRVGQSMYKIEDKHVLINGYPFLPYVPEPTVYEIGKITPEIKSYYDKMILPLIQRELSRKSKCDKARWNKFAKIIHPFKSEDKSTGGINIQNIDSFENNFIEINYKVPMEEMVVFAAKQPQNVIKENTKIAITRIMFQFIKHIEVVNTLCEYYDTDEKENEIDQVWNLYIENKK